MFALAISITPALADSRGGNGGQWFVMSDSMDLTGMSVTCGDNTYSVTSGTSDFVLQMRGSLDPITGEALTAGHGIETWTLDNVEVLDGHGVSHHVVGSQQIKGTWLAGSYPEGSGPLTSGSRIVKLQVEGTTDGLSIVARQLGNGSFSEVTSGDCPSPWG